MEKIVSGVQETIMPGTHELIGPGFEIISGYHSV